MLGFSLRLKGVGVEGTPEGPAAAQNMEARADALPSGPRAPCWAVLVLHGS